MPKTKSQAIPIAHLPATHAASLLETQPIQIQHGDRFIKIKAVMDITSRKKTQIYADPTFPRPIKLGARESAWLYSQVMAWMQNRVNASITETGREAA